MRKILKAALAAAAFLCPLRAKASATYAPQAMSSTGGTISTVTACPSGVTVTAPGGGTAEITVSGTFTATLAIKASGDFATFSPDLTAYPRAGGAGVTSITTTGTWTLPMMADVALCIYGQGYTSGTAVVSVSVAPTASRVYVTNTAADPLFVSGSLSVSGAADTVGGNATFNANAVCATVAIAGQTGVGFFLGAGSPTETLTPSVSKDNTNWTPTSFVDVSGNTSATIVNPVGFQDPGLVIRAGDRFARVCTTAYASGSAVGFLVASTAAARPPAAGADVTDRAGRLLGILSAGANVIGAVTQSGTWTVQPGNTANTTAWKVDGSAVTQPVSGTVTTTPPANASTNVAQINGVTPLMGNGVSGTGAPRVTLASDSTGQVAIAGTANVQGLGTAGAPSGGVQTMQGSASGTPLPVSNAATAPLFANAVDNFAVAATLNAACTTTTACSAASSIQWAMNGSAGATVTITAISSPVGIALACDESWDGGTTYLLAGCDLWQRGAYRTGALANADLVAATQWFIFAPGSPSHIRIRASTFTSGSTVVAGRGTLIATSPFPVEAKTPTQATVTLTASTSETTLMAAGGAGIFLDLTSIKCSNTSATASAISVRDATAGTVRDTLVCPAAIGPCEGNVYRVPFRQTTSNANWTIQAGTSASSLICTAQAVPR